MIPMLAAALDYGGRGWPVLPLFWPVTTGNGARCACGSATCRSVGKHPHARLVRRGLNDASTDPSIINAWWKASPRANVAIVLGKAAGLFALDVDPRHNGDRALVDLVRDHGPLGETLHAFTGGGGDHYVFRWPGRPVQGAAHKLGEGLDVKGDGGYIVAPPSLHPSGAPYTWERLDVEAVAAPPWVLEKVLRAEQTRPATPRTAARARRALPTVQEHQALDLLVRECAFIDHAARDAASLSYDEWFSLATVLHVFPAGDELFDQISRLDPLRYREREARKKTTTIHGRPRHCTSLGWSCPRLNACASIGVQSPAGLPFKLMAARKGAA